MIADDIGALARDGRCRRHGDPDLQLVTQALSIATFRFVPADLRSSSGRGALRNI